MISGSSVLLDLPRSQRNGAPRRLRCRRACGSTRGLCSSAGVRTPDSGHTDSLVRLDNNRSPLSRWDDLFYFAERVSNKISSSGQRRGRRRSAVNHFRVKALGRTQPPGPKPLVGHLRTPILGVLCLAHHHHSLNRDPPGFFYKAQDKGLWVCVAHLSPRSPKQAAPR